MFYQFKQNKKIFLTLALAFLAVGGILGSANPVLAVDTYDEYSQQASEEVQGATQEAATNYSGINIPTDSSNTRIPVVSGVISIVLLIVMKFLSALVQLGGALVDYSLSFESFTKAPVVLAGWQITRDLCNMGFAAILLFMAFATVLGQETYGLKKLLPRLITVALLINFSLFFAGLIIDFSQILTYFFLDAVRGENGVAANLMNSLAVSRLFDFKNPTTSVLNVFMGVEFSVIIEMIAGCILFLITAFLFFAMAIFLFTRLITLWVLLIFAPLAWLTHIVKVPGFADFSWEKWWGEFLKWTFFAPSYAFFIYLAVFVAQKLSTGDYLISDASLTTIQTNTQGIFGSGFFSDPKHLLQYIIVIIILLMGFGAAQKVGGNTKLFGMALANKISKGGIGLAKRPFGFAYDKAAPAVVKSLGAGAAVVGLAKFGRRLQATGTRIQQGVTEKPQHKAYARTLDVMSNKDILNEAKSAWGARKLIATEKAVSRGVKDLEIMDVQTLSETLKNFNKVKELKELQELRPDAVADEKERTETILRAIENGNAKKWPPSMLAQVDEKNKKNVLVDVQGNPISKNMLLDANGRPTGQTDGTISMAGNIARIMQNELNPDVFADTFKSLPKQIKLGLEAAMAENLKDFNIPQQELEKLRANFATATGKIKTAFTDFNNKFQENSAKAFILKMKVAQIGNVNGEEDLKTVGQFISQSLLASVRGELNAFQKEKIVEGALSSNNQEAIDYFENTPANSSWGKIKGKIINPATGQPF